MKKLVLGTILLGSIAFAGFIGSGGVRSVKDAGYFDKTSWVIVTCNDGKSYRIGKMDGGEKWWGDMGGTLPSDFNGLSLSEASAKACR